MTNIPTDLLRTLVAVVDLGSFTKASVLLGLTQPAVSAQIKRLQSLLDVELFDRSMQGISLTPQGEIVISYARRLLSINDQIMHLSAGDVRPEAVVRVGTTSDYIASILPTNLARIRERWTDVRFIVRTASYDALMRNLRSGGLDLVFGLSINPPPDAYRTAPKETVWARGVSTMLDLDKPVPLVTYGDVSAYHRIAVTALQAAGLNWEAVFTGPNVHSLSAAIAAGLEVMPVGRKVANDIGMIIWEDAPLPRLPNLYSGIYVREGGESAAYQQIADDLAETLYGASHQLPKLVVDRSRNSNPAA